MSNEVGKREWRFYVEDMVTFCDRVISYTNGLDRSSFVVDPMRYDATLRNLELIGEAATHVPTPKYAPRLPTWPGERSSQCAID
jgi:uncharacterized protein with HEPN domain